MKSTWIIAVGLFHGEVKMKSSGKSILILLGGMWHDFDGFSHAMKPTFEAEGWQVESSYDLEVLTRLEMVNYDLILSYTCLFKHRAGYDDTGPEKLTNEQVHGLRRWVRNGGGLLAAHAATCIADSSPELGTLLGGVFVSHPEPFTFNIYPLASGHPITADIQALEVYDEFYIQKYSPSVEIHMVAVYQDVVYPMVWSRREGKGHVAYVAPGHFPDVWNHAAYQRLMLQTASWLINS
jgi:type 1 glutamine amidotransferase